MRTAVDTSVVVAALCGWHDRHDSARAALDDALAGEVVVATRVVVEAYAVLTRLPGRHRVAAADALAVLRELFDAADIVELGQDPLWRLLEDAVARGVGGGAVYDAEIAQCAREAGANRLITLNERHFAAWGDEGLRIESPA